MKQIYNKCGVWNENYGSLLDELKDSKRTVCYRSILISEIENLIEFLSSCFQKKLDENSKETRRET